MALRQVVLKIHSRCNLACTYCYIYKGPDDSWRSQPRRMDLAVVERTAARMREHASLHRITEYTVILHGGEPMQAGAPFIDKLACILRDALPGLKVDLCIQTNGTLLDKAALEVFERHGIRVGVSLDGGESDNDRRMYSSGKASYHKAEAGLRLLRRYPTIYSGILATVNLESNPVKAYESLLRFDPPKLDFLLPHGTWENRPPGRTESETDAPYADWLIEIFDLWFYAKSPPTKIRLFDSLLSLLRGGVSHTEVLGLHPIDLVTIETNGSIEQGDVLKVTGNGAAATGLHVNTSTFDDVLAHPGIQARRQGLAGLGSTCQRCELVKVCGGGHHAHRYRDRHFLNPSVYCVDLAKLIRHAEKRIGAV